MKFVGILKKHESGRNSIGQSIEELKPSSDVEDSDSIISYLSNGTLVIAFLHYVHDSNGEAICPLIFYTDGKWVWPSYLAYYIKKHYYSLLLDEFISDIKNNNFIPPQVNSKQKEEAEKLYVSIYGQ